MSTFLADPVLMTAVSILLKASILLGAALLAQVFLRRRGSAAARHLVWTLTIGALLLLPVLSIVLPAWPIVTRTVITSEPVAPLANAVEPRATSARRVVDAATPAPAAAVSAPREGGLSWSNLIAGAYASVVAAMVLLLAVQRNRVRQLAREAARVDDAEWTNLLDECRRRLGIRRSVRLLRSRERSMPMALGIRQPAILIPSIADTWPADRRRAVILHELAHVARYDCLVELLAFAACTLYWFHPMAWWAARRLQVERELACDDLVIATGASAREYAGHLLEIAYSFGNRRAPALALSMARPRDLERRLLAVVDDARNHRVPAAGLRIGGAIAVAFLLIPFASATANVVAANAAVERPHVDTQKPQPHRTEARLKSFDTVAIEAGLRLLRAVASSLGVSQDRLPGTWELRPTNIDGVVHLRIVEVNSSLGSNIPIELLEGLTATQLATAAGPVQFRLERDAGTFTFEGTIRSGVGAGTFTFAPDPGFAQELVKRGYRAPTALEQYMLARHDVGYVFLDELTRQGYARPDTADLARAGQHGVSTMYLREMGALGYRLGTVGPLITLRDHGVTPGYIRGLAEQGYKGLPADDLREARDHGVTPDFVRAMRDAGFQGLSIDDLIKARDHGVSADFARSLEQAGHSLALPDLIRARDHGVSVEYVQAMRDAGYGSLAMDRLIAARDHGVDIDFVRGITALGYQNLAIESLIRLRDHGVTPSYAQAIRSLGYDNLTIDDLVMLRDRGLTADRVRTLNMRAGSRLPIDLLKSLAQ